MPKYRALVGLDYPTKAGDKRAEPGDVVSDLPTKSVEWLLDGGYIEPADAKAPADEEVED
jgi:hypothetical protein